MTQGVDRIDAAGAEGGHADGKERHTAQ
jgi:hypothetical protein